jgi:membrane protein DedA with SNARE-associated domain
VLTSLLERLLNVPAPVVLAVVGALVFAEDALFFGFVIPGETVAILGGVSASLGHVPLWAVLTVVIVAAIVGDSVGFEVGRRLGPWLMATRPLARHADRLDDARDLLARRGGSAVLLGRWVAFFRAVMPALAGTSDMRYRTFLTYNAVGGILWGTVVVMGGYLAGASYQAVADALGTGSAVLVGVAAIAGFVVWRLRRRRSGPVAAPADSPDAGDAPADVPAGPAGAAPTD